MGTVMIYLIDLAHENKVYSEHDRITGKRNVGK